MSKKVSWESLKHSFNLIVIQDMEIITKCEITQAQNATDNNICVIIDA